MRSAKALTTHDDLALGVSNALSNVMDGVAPSAVGLVSISTTLATNAVVEGRGSAVLVVLVGFDDQMIERTGITSAFPDAVLATLDGGHDHYGNERAPLDVDRVDQVLADHGDDVSAVAIAGAFAVRNPAHEEAVRDRVLERTDLPVTVSSALSDALDAPRRALTTALNARLLARISDLIAAVERSVKDLEIDAPILVAKGDGSLAVAADVARRPIETVLSGPAASIVGAGELCGLDDFILSDVGGTTTDVGQLRNGRPRLVADGARVGGWRTMVEAIDVRTTGLGGDSSVVTDGRDIVLGPTRRVPLSLLAVDHPTVLPTLRRQLRDPPSRDLAGVFIIARQHGEPRSDIERRLVERVGSESCAPLVDVVTGSVERRALDQMVKRGDLGIGGFTPSDAAHVLGLQGTWHGAAASAGAELLGWYTSDTGTEFASRVRSEMERRSAACVLEVAMDQEVMGNPVIDAVISGLPRVGVIAVALSMTTPLIAVGGPAGVFYPEVGARIGCDPVLPQHYAVANAVGAAAGSIVVRTRAEVHSDGPGSYRVVASDGTTQVEGGAIAIEHATAAARNLARRALGERAKGIGTLGSPEEFIEVERHTDPDAGDDDGLYGAVVHFELRARPTG